MRKDVLMCASIDPDGARILAALAERETEGNRSQMLRRVIREAGERRGMFWQSDAQAERLGTQARR